jgi:tRNA threonylcarbamoyladenosine modification (KEOPS) complex Cgi121 subunit
LIEEIEEFNKYIAIEGYRDAKIDDPEEFLNSVRRKTKPAEVQFFNARLVAGKDHLYFAALNALTAFKSGVNRSRNLAVETLLYASAQRQIKNAVSMIGISPTSTEVAVLIIAKTRQQADTTVKVVSELIPGQRNEHVLELTAEKFADLQKFFGISDTELESKLATKGRKEEALVDLVIEQVALLTTAH